MRFYPKLVSVSPTYTSAVESSSEPRKKGKMGVTIRNKTYDISKEDVEKKLRAIDNTNVENWKKLVMTVFGEKTYKELVLW